MKRLKTHWDTFFHLKNDYYAKPVHVFQIIKISLNPVFFILSGWKLHFNNMVKNLSAKYEPDWVKEIYAPEKWCRTNWQTDRQTDSFRAPQTDSYRAPQTDCYRAPQTDSYRAPQCGVVIRLNTTGIITTVN